MIAIGAELQVDLAALVHNWRQIAYVARPGSCAAVVKADGYGLGAVRVSQALIGAGCRMLFVATADEALALRAAGIAVDVFVFEGARAESVEALAAANIAPVLNDAAQCARWLKLKQRLQRPLMCALHVDTGMARLGFSVDELLHWSQQRDRVQLLAPQFLMTHLACADEPQHPLNAVQLARFARCREMLPGLPVSIGNSAGALAAAARSDEPADGADTRGDLVRPGIALYGGNPFVDQRALPLREVVQLRAPVLQVRELPAHESVGYGASVTTQGSTRIATVGLGYADGYLRSLSNSGRALVAGVEVPVLGRVSMDLVMVDVSALASPVTTGTWVTFLGGGIGLDQTAAAAGTISYELLVRMGPRVARRYINSTANEPATEAGQL